MEVTNGYQSDTVFPLLETVVDDSPFVYSAMGFLCEFHELSTDQMELTLAFAHCRKQQERVPERWES
jgi:hypothetical protein